MNKKIPVILLILMMVTNCSGTIPDLGVNNGELKPCPKTPNCVNSQAADEKHYITPIHFPRTQQEAQNRLLQILASERNAMILKNQHNYIRVEFISALFRFVDDVEFYFSEKPGDGTIIHVRSASRIGYSDLGANRERVEKIRSKFLINYKK